MPKRLPEPAEHEDQVEHPSAKSATGAETCQPWGLGGFDPPEPE
jgi:hypothetical protein